MMSEIVERGAPSKTTATSWNENNADADGSYHSHVPGMGRRLAGYSGPFEQPALARRANLWPMAAPQPKATRSSQTLARLANRNCVALARFSSHTATAIRCVYSDPDELAAVRCCGSAGTCYSVCGSPNGLARAVRNMTIPQAAPFILDESTCGIDSRLSTRAEASTECLAHGLQLCTLAQYRGCRRRGCNYDAAWAWVQDECPACTRGLSSQTRSRAPPARNCDGRNRLGGTAAAFYCAHSHAYGIFCNRCDLDMQNEVLRAATAATATAEPLHVFAVGTFDGADLERTARQPWFDSGRSTLHGWELQPQVYSEARRRMRALPETIASRVRLTNAAVGAESAVLQFVETRGQTTHVQKMSRTDGRKAQDRTRIPSVSWADEAAARGVREVTYALVDVEGYEVPAIQGMRLETNAAVFPVFQYELGGTWVDDRHATNWTQYDLAVYLERLGYKLFLIGMREDVAKVDRTVLLSLTAASYRDTAWCQLGKKHPHGLHYGDSADCCTLNLEGNMLAVHVEALASKQWLVDLIAGLSLV
jgi:FkbM family methyltransferase